MIYTAHGFHFFEGAPLRNWFLYYPLEWISAFGTDVLITINKEDYRRAKRFHAGTAKYVPGVGVDVERFGVRPADSSVIRRDLGLSENSFTVLSVGELNDNKNHKTIIKAISLLKAPSVRYLLCGDGPGRLDLERLAQDLGIADRVKFLGYRRDIPELLAAADVFCHASFREGLPLSLMEAMAAGKAIVASRIRGAVDLIIPDIGGILIEEADDSVAFASALDSLAANTNITRQMGRHNAESVRSFSAANVISFMKRVYEVDGSVESDLSAARATLDGDPRAIGGR